MGTLFLDLPDGRLAYDDAGSGPLVVCVPGMGDLRSEYRFLIPQLVAAGYRAVSMDVRGHGETSPTWLDYSVGMIGADMLAMIRSLDAGPAVVVGTSMAAGAAVWTAAEAPELVSGLVLIGPFVRGERNWFGSLFSALLAATFSRPWGPWAWLKYYSTLYPSRKPADFAEYSAVLRANLAEPGRVEALQHMIRASKAASEARLPQVKTSVMVLMGSKDPDFKDPAAEASWVAGRLHGEYRMLGGAGHYPHAELPEVAGPLVLSFLESLQLAAEKVYAP